MIPRAQELAMHLHLTNTQFFSVAIALVVTVFLAALALVAYLDGRRRRKPPFLNYFRAGFDQEQFDENLPRRPSFIASDARGDGRK
jgi:hypothetical protein